MEALFFSYITTLHLKVYFFSAVMFLFFFFVGTFHLMTDPYLILLIRNFVIFIYISFFFFFFPEASSRKCGVGWEVGLDSTCYQINSDQRKLWAGL